MTRANSRRVKRTAVEGNDSHEDRISNLPRNVTNHILGLLPVKEAARTSILSTKWRHIWAMLPSLLLDNTFCKKLAGKSLSIFKETVDTILLQHFGVIDKFVLDVSEVHLTSYEYIDRWMLYVTRNSVKELTFKLSIGSSAYKLPSHVFNCLTLTDLKLFNCVFKPPNSILGFQNLINLSLERITFVPLEFSVINCPLLTDLIMRDCIGTQHLSIVSSRLQHLGVFGSHYPNLNCFNKCKDLMVLHLGYSNLHYIPKHDERSTLEKLLFSLAPTIVNLYLDSLFLKVLSGDTVPKGLSFSLNCLLILWLRVNIGELGQTSYALQLIKSSPNLSKLDFWVYATSNNDLAVSTYLGTPACLDLPFNKLEHVLIHQFKGSKAELSLVKLLFARAPSLIRMIIEPAKASDFKERYITTELMRFPRASPKAELFYLPSSTTSRRQ